MKALKTKDINIEYRRISFRATGGRLMYAARFVNSDFGFYDISQKKFETPEAALKYGKLVKKRWIHLERKMV